jgi:hypothetical protein
MHERRQTPRKIADQRILVQDMNAGQPLGRVVNLSTEGLMLVGNTAVESNLVFQLELTLQEPHRGRRQLHLGVESLWCSEAGEGERFWSGYRIIDVSLDAIDLIESLVESWKEASD